MPFEIVTIPCLADNYAYLLHDPETAETALVDAPEAGPIREALARRGWKLDHILITHHHPDHVGAVEELCKISGARVWGAARDAHRLPPLDTALQEGNSVVIGAQTGQVIDVPGHTLGHIAFHFPESRAVFTADSLMALGCGRLFEGTAEQMWSSLSKLAALPPETLVCSGHEYTEANARFALTIEPGNPALQARAEEVFAERAAGQPTVPSLLSQERATNPFLRANEPAVRARLGMEDAPAAAVFAEIRHRKDSF